MEIKMNELSLNTNAISECNKVLKSGKFVYGELCNKFEKKIETFLNVDFCVVTSSGTTALYTALNALEIRQNDLIYTTPFTFVATVSTPKLFGCKLEYIDFDSRTFQISFEELVIKCERKKPKAVIVVHLFGNSCEIDKIAKYCKKKDILLIEDCAQSFGTKYNNQYVGSFGDVSIFSFYPTKNLTTMEGGAVVTNNMEIYNRAKNFINHGQSDTYKYIAVGTNFRMLEISAAIGNVEILNIEERIKRKRKKAQEYLSKIKNSKIILPYFSENVYHSFNQFTILVKDRKDFIKYLKKNGIESKVFYPELLSEIEFLADINFRTKNINTTKEIISIPIRYNMSNNELQKVIKVLNEW
ncbi:MAG: DegT/DnrJ/EryC1/StrS family aminotransferase [Mycoplasmatales bacterium]